MIPVFAVELYGSAQAIIQFDTRLPIQIFMNLAEVRVVIAYIDRLSVRGEINLLEFTTTV